MKKSFLKNFTRPSEQLTKQISFSKSQWDEIEAYRRYLASKLGFEVKVSELFKNLVNDHLVTAKEFQAEKGRWHNESASDMVNV